MVTGGKRRAASVRRAPVQARSRRRVAEILDGTARLVDEVGPDAVTTTSIAERLGIAVGSVYTYFRDRSAIFDEIVAATIADNDRLVGALRANPPTDDWLLNGAHVIDRLADVYRSAPGFRALYLSRHVSPAMVEAMRRTDEEQAQARAGRPHRPRAITSTARSPSTCCGCTSVWWTRGSISHSATTRPATTA